MLRAAIEIIVLALVALSPWAFGAVHPASIFILYCGLSAALVLWSVLIIVERRVSVAASPPLICLTLLVLLGIFQLIPFNKSILSTLSSSAAAVRTDLFPEQLESLTGDNTVYPPSWTITIDANATQNRVVQLIGLIALFALVRFAIATPASFRRFAVVCTTNGALLSLLALAQRFSSSPETIYWSYPSLGSAFGPFVCKNNFPDYVNICLFLSIGLLLGTSLLRQRARNALEWLADLTQSPASLWLITAAGLMVTAVLFSMSRGGAIALAGAALGCLALTMRARRFRSSLGLLALVGGMTVAAIVWFGVDQVGERLGTLSEHDANQGRRELWERSAPLAARFPVWGTGLGTFETVEPQTRKPGDDQFTWEHAHNDYLEGLIEGGVLNLCLLLLIVWFVLRDGLRALDRLRDHTDAALVIGGLAGFSAVVLHSFGDFGIHIPAVAVLVVVLLAHLSAAAAPQALPKPSTGQILAVPVVLACWIIAIVLPIDGWLRERADYYRLAAVRAGNRLPPGERDTVIRYLKAALEFTPRDAAIRARLADAQYEEFLARERAAISPSMQKQLVDEYLRPALTNYLILRASNPLYPQPHARLAGNRQYLQHPDSVANYLSRATRLRPVEDGLWYLAGLDRLSSGDPDAAWEDWRRSLRCSPAHLESILAAALVKLGPERTVDAVMPPQPSVLLQAARSRALAEKNADRRAFSARAAAALADQTLTTKEDLYARAWLLREAGQKAEAIRAYESALLQSPGSHEWRLELAELQFETGDLDGAERRLRQLLVEKPDLSGVGELNGAIVKARAKIE